MDTELFFRLYGDGHGALGAVMVALSALGSGWSVLGLPPLLALRRTRGVAAPLLAALVVTSAVVFALKAAVGRARPCWALPGVRSIFFAAPTDGSFPSGHAAGSFCVAAYLAALAARAPWPAPARAVAAAALACVAGGIALSRVYLGVHYPLDVAGGAALGATLGAAFALRPWARPIQTPPAE